MELAGNLMRNILFFVFTNLIDLFGTVMIFLQLGCIFICFKSTSGVVNREWFSGANEI